MDSFKGTFGYMGAMVVYFLIFLVFVGLAIFGYFLFNSAKNDICLKKEIQTQTTPSRTTRRGSVIPEKTEEVEVCVEEGKIGDASIGTKAKYYGGITMMIVFGLIALIMILPYIIQGLGYAIGFIIASYFE